MSRIEEIDVQIKKLQAQIILLQREKNLYLKDLDRNRTGSAKETIMKSTDLENSGDNNREALLNGDWE
jgi:hypothetical protein